MNPLFQKAETLFRKKRADNTYKRLEKLIEDGEKILDLGAGDCFLAKKLTEQKKVSITAVDVIDYNETDLPLILYDGEKIPFPDKTFDTTLLLTVLHHCYDPIAVIKEAIRVTKNKIIIEEDVYGSKLQKKLTFLIDELFNKVEEIKTPHSNKTKDGWLKSFEELGLKPTKIKNYHTFFVLDQVVFSLKIT